MWTQKDLPLASPFSACRPACKMKRFCSGIAWSTWTTKIAEIQTCFLCDFCGLIFNLCVVFFFLSMCGVRTPPWIGPRPLFTVILFKNALDGPKKINQNKMLNTILVSGRPLLKLAFGWKFGLAAENPLGKRDKMRVLTQFFFGKLFPKKNPKDARKWAFLADFEGQKFMGPWFNK